MATFVGNVALERREPAVAPDTKGPSRIGLAIANRSRRTARFLPSHRLALITAGIVFAVFFAVVAAQAMVASRQIRIDNLQQQLATSVAVNENLQVERAGLTAPSRILSIAEKKLGMTTPAKVTYLAPVAPASVRFPTKAPTR